MSRPRKPKAAKAAPSPKDAVVDAEVVKKSEPEPEVEVEAQPAEAEELTEPKDGELEEVELEPTALAPVDEKALRSRDPLAAYMHEVQRHKLLSREEELALAKRYRDEGDLRAAAKLVASNLRLVVKLAHEYHRNPISLLDLIQEGNIGLMQAVKKFDPERGVKLSSYAAWWIRAYMLRFILNNWRLVKIGTTQAQRRLFFNLNKEKARLTAMGIEPTHSTIATNLRVDEKDVVEMDRRLARGDASLDAPVGDAEGRQTTRMELLTATSNDPEVSAESTELSELVRRRLDEFRKTLSGKELQIFDDRLVAEDPLTLQELGDRFGVSRERVRQLEARLTGKLRTFLKSELGDAVEVGA